MEGKPKFGDAERLGVGEPQGSSPETVSTEEHSPTLLEVATPSEPAATALKSPNGEASTAEVAAVSEPSSTAAQEPAPDAEAAVAAALSTEGEPDDLQTVMAAVFEANSEDKAA